MNTLFAFLKHQNFITPTNLLLRRDTLLPYNAAAILTPKIHINGLSKKRFSTAQPINPSNGFLHDPLSKKSAPFTINDVPEEIRDQVKTYDLKKRYTPEAWKSLEDFWKQNRRLSQHKQEAWHQLARDLGLTRGQVRRFFWYKNVEFGVLNPAQWIVDPPQPAPTLPKKKLTKKERIRKRILSEQASRELKRQFKQKQTTPTTAPQQDGKAKGAPNDEISKI